jgi:molybdenum transport protein
MVFFKENEIDYYISEDLPYFDLTTEVLGIGDKKAKITFKTRDDTVISCSEEAQRVLEKLGAKDIAIVPSGTMVKAGETFITAFASARTLHQAWKICQNILEYACGVATYTYDMVNKARKYNKHIEILTTRKTQPGNKKIAIKSVMAGGGSIHRLGNSETFLLFGNHRNFFEKEQMLEKIVSCKKKLVEKKLLVEVGSIDEAKEFAEVGIRLFQIEKMSPVQLQRGVKELKEKYSDISLLATGGITLENVQEYASCGVDGIVTTAPYFAKSANIKVEITPIKQEKA